LRRVSLAAEVFLITVAAAFITAVAVGLVAHESLVSIVHAAVGGVPAITRGMEEASVLKAEQEAVANFDAIRYLLALFAAGAAATASLIVVARLTRPARQLQAAADEFARGDRSRRARVQGPNEMVSLSISFNRLADAIEDEEHLRRKLVADISHELRNPIAVALAQTEAMVAGVLPADTAQLELLLLDIQHMGALMDDLQELALTESGRWRYEMEEIDLTELLLANARRTAQLAEPTIEVVLTGANYPVCVKGDAMRLDQVLRNLLGNARRHTTAGSITISLEQGPDEVTVRIADTGEGISAEDLPHIFDRFFRADPARTQDSGGAGLGLSIVRSVIADHGGSVFAESEIGRGTVIGFTLPRAVPDSDSDGPCAETKISA
jgi:two-component system sensor histidine kinase BaeS